MYPVSSSMNMESLQSCLKGIVHRHLWSTRNPSGEQQATALHATIWASHESISTAWCFCSTTFSLVPKIAHKHKQHNGITWKCPNWDGSVHHFAMAQSCLLRLYQASKLWMQTIHIIICLYYRVYTCILQSARIRWFSYIQIWQSLWQVNSNSSFHASNNPSTSKNYNMHIKVSVYPPEN